MRLAAVGFVGLLLLGAVSARAEEAVSERAMRGVELAKQGKTNQAIDELLAAIDVNPKDNVARMNLASIYEREGRLDEAVYHYEKVLKADPQNSTSHNNLGVLYDRKGLSDEAISEFEAAVETDSKNSLAAKNLQTAKKNQTARQERERQIAAAKQAAEARPDSPRDVYNLARTYAFYGENDQAMASLEKALRLGFNDLAYIKTDVALEGLRNDPNYQRLLSTR
jgi:tetratricopeptide (TPR) repeat protein